MTVTKPEVKTPEKFRWKAIGISSAAGFGIAALLLFIFPCEACHKPLKHEATPQKDLRELNNIKSIRDITSAGAISHDELYFYFKYVNDPTEMDRFRNERDEELLAFIRILITRLRGDEASRDQAYSILTAIQTACPPRSAEAWESWVAGKRPADIPWNPSFR